jgi:sirohydrochlorin cobaltochelatase
MLENPCTNPMRTSSKSVFLFYERTGIQVKKAILSVSFGTTYKSALQKSIKALENDFADEFPDYDIFNAFTSKMILKSLKSDGIEIDYVSEALKKLSDSNYDEVIVQPSHLISGEEYDKLCRDAEVYRDKFSTFKIGRTLLYSTEDLKQVCGFFYSKFCNTNALVLMGHGTEHYINSIYTQMNDVCRELGYNRIFIGTVEAYPDITDIIPKIRENGCKKVILTPLMFVAGDHAHNDMAGDEADSWKSRLESEGIAVETVIKGMGEYPEIREMYIRHLRSTIMEVEST